MNEFDSFLSAIGRLGCAWMLKSSYDEDKRVVCVELFGYGEEYGGAMESGTGDLEIDGRLAEITKKLNQLKVKGQR